MPPIGAERHIEQFGSLFLRWRGLEVGVIYRPIEFGISRGRLQCFGRFFDDCLQRGSAVARIGGTSRPIEHQPRLDQRVGHQQIGLSKIAQSVAHCLGEFRFAQYD